MKTSSSEDVDVSEDSLSSEDGYGIYEPQEDSSLENEEKKYDKLEYISLDWPAQSVDVARGFTIVLGTNPVEEVPKMVSVDLFPTYGLSKPHKMKISKKDISESYNMIRTNGAVVYCLSDRKFVIHDLNFEEVYQRDCNEDLGYGLCFCSIGCCYGTKSGDVSINDWKQNEVFRIKAHEDSVEGLCGHEKVLFSASCDNSIAFLDIRTSRSVFKKGFDVDINVIDFNGDYILAFGDDAGIVRIMDIRNYSVEKVFQHNSSVSCLRWRNKSVFVSGCDEQLSIFDISLDSASEKGCLLFVHRGQRFYKDVSFCKGDDSYVVTTSVDGLCVFRPVSFCSDNASSNEV